MKAANGIGPGAGKGARAEAEARTITNAKKRERAQRELVKRARRVAYGDDLFERLTLAKGIGHA